MRQWVLRIAVCLVLGAVTTVAVAWYFAWTVRLDDKRLNDRYRIQHYGEAVSGGHQLLVAATDVSGAERWQVARVEGLLSPNMGIIVEAPHMELLMPPYWMAIDGPIPTRGEIGKPDADLVTVLSDGHSRGWPFRCMYSQTDQIWTSSSGGSTVFVIALPIRPDGIRHGIPIYEAAANGRRLARILPLGVIWFGFAIDSMLYAVPWLMVFTAFGTVRRTLRRLRNRCPACGYDLTGNTSGHCPECGAATGIAGDSEEQPA